MIERTFTQDRLGMGGQPIPEGVFRARVDTHG
jgi:hypothetical protein